MILDWVVNPYPVHFAGIELQDIPTQTQTDSIITIQDNSASVTLPPEVFQTNGTSGMYVTV